MAQYEYDGQGRRIVKKTYTGGTLSETRHFYWSNQWQDLEERVGTATTADKQQVWGIRYVDELVCRDDATPLRLYGTQDANFNLAALIDTSANVKERFIYEPYGLSTVLTAAWASTTDAYAWGWRHQGLMEDSDSRLVYNRYRNLHARLGLFLVRDLIGYQSGMHLYEYTGGEPIAQLDPSGLLFGICCDLCDPKKSKPTLVKWKVLIVPNGTQFPPENENVDAILEGVKNIETLNDLADKLDGQVIGNSPSGGADSGKGIAKMIKGAMSAAKKRNGVEIMVIVRVKRCEQESCLIFFSRFNFVESNDTYVSTSGDGNAPMNLAGQGYDPSNIAGILRDVPKAVKDAIASALK